MQTFYFYAGVLDDKSGEAHTSYYPHAVREGETAREACESIVRDYREAWPNCVIGPSGRSVTLNPGNSRLMTLVIGKAPR